MAFFLMVAAIIVVTWLLLAWIFGGIGGFVIDKVLKPFNNIKDGNKKEEE